MRFKTCAKELVGYKKWLKLKQPYLVANKTLGEECFFIGDFLIKDIFERVKSGH